MIFDESDLKNWKNQCINHIQNFNNEHIIQHYNANQYNIPEEEHYISCMTPTGFINDQYESRFCVNLSFQVHFFSIFFGQLIINIDCDKIIEDLDDSVD